MTINAAQASSESVGYVDTVAGFRVPVNVGGPEDASWVVIFHDATDDASPYQAVCRRLHVAQLRTVRIAANPGLSAKLAAGLLDALQVTGAMLVGDRAGAELAWELAATFPERFTGLVVIDCGHPRVPDVTGVIRDERCPHVHTDTTVLVSGRVADGVARASRRYVQGEFRLTELAGWRGSRHFITQFTTEILLRRHSWP